MTKILIIGAGHAGGSVAAFLRQYGHEGPIMLVGEEEAPPYQRPPLSKAWLKGEADLEALLLRPLSFYEEQGIEFRASTVAVSVDPETKTVAFHDGSSETYDVLVLATGSTARKLPVPGGDHPELLELRTLKDAERLKAVLGQLPEAQVISKTTPVEAKRAPAPPKQLSAPKHAATPSAPPSSATQESTVSASKASANNNWRVVRKAKRSARKTRMKRPARRAASGYKAAKRDGYVFTSKELQGVAKRRNEAFNELDRALEDN